MQFKTSGEEVKQKLNDLLEKGEIDQKLITLFGPRKLSHKDWKFLSDIGDISEKEQSLLFKELTDCEIVLIANSSDLVPKVFDAQNIQIITKNGYYLSIKVDEYTGGLEFCTIGCCIREVRSLTELVKIEAYFDAPSTTYAQPEYSYTKSGNVAAGALVGGIIGGATGAVIGAAAASQPKKQILIPANVYTYMSLHLKLTWKDGTTNSLGVAEISKDAYGRYYFTSYSCNAVNKFLYKDSLCGFNANSIINGKVAELMQARITLAYQKIKFKTQYPEKHKRYIELLELAETFDFEKIFETYGENLEELDRLTEELNNVKGIFKSFKVKQINEKIKEIKHTLSTMEDDYKKSETLYEEFYDLVATESSLHISNK